MEMSNMYRSQNIYPAKKQVLREKRNNTCVTNKFFFQRMGTLQADWKEFQREEREMY